MEFEDRETDEKLKNTFLPYVQKIWIDSKECIWGEGANPWAVSHNNSLERFNLFVKESYTFRKRLSLPLLFQSIELMLKEWSFENDENLFKPRLSILESEIGYL